MTLSVVRIDHGHGAGWYLQETVRGSRHLLQGPWADADRAEAERALVFERRERARRETPARHAVGEGGDW